MFIFNIKNILKKEQKRYSKHKKDFILSWNHLNSINKGDLTNDRFCIFVIQNRISFTFTGELFKVMDIKGTQPVYNTMCKKST